MKRSEWVLLSGLVGGWAGVFGCMREGSVEEQSEVERLPVDLETMQGSWLAEATSLCGMCIAVFNGYTLRLRYRQVSAETLMKRNISIKAVDMKKKLLLFHSPGGAWNYTLYQVGDEEFLKLEFYSDICHSWLTFDMKRSS